MTTYDSRAFRQVVLEEMETQGITPLILAARLYVTPASVSRRLSGEGRTQTATAIKYADALGVPRGDFFDRIRKCVFANQMLVEVRK